MVFAATVKAITCGEGAAIGTAECYMKASSCKRTAILSFLLLFLPGVFLQNVDDKREYKRVCYYTNWAQYRPDGGKFMPENIQPDLCTHLVYAFAKLEQNEIKPLEWNDLQLYKTFNALKSKSRNLKTLIAIGGWNAGSAAFSQMVQSASRRDIFIKSVIKFCRAHGFDGLDLDWEYPGMRGGRPEDKGNLILLLKEMRDAFMTEVIFEKRRPLFLTIAVPAGKLSVDTGYDVPQISKYLDFISLMAYDLHGSWGGLTGENAPLHPRGAENGDQKHLNVEWAAKYWVSKGAPKKKLIIGMPTYGRTFTLADPRLYGVAVEAPRPGMAGKYTRENGFLSYYEICMLEETTKGKTYWDNEGMVPYFVDGFRWVGFDNVKSISMKTKWLIEEGFGGAMVWSLALDDFGKMCKSSSRPYPLISTIHDLLIQAEKGFARRIQTTTTTPLPLNPDDDFSCVGRENGLYQDPMNCQRFYICNWGKAYSFGCPSYLRFNPKKYECDWPTNVVCHIKF